MIAWDQRQTGEEKKADEDENNRFHTKKTTIEQYINLNKG